MPPTPVCVPPRLRSRDLLLLAVLCVTFYGYALVGGRPLTMHEAVLPQTANEMFQNHDWVIPRSGERPWLERPPLPQWVVASLDQIAGRGDQVWLVRLPSILVATMVVLLTAWMGSRFGGRSVGLLSGLLLATMFEFVSYAWLAESDIYLCGLTTLAVALFVKQELASGTTTDNRVGFFGARSPWVLAFFFVLGMTNLAKGLLFGTVMAGLGIVTFLIWNQNITALRRYVWLWGWLAFLAVALPWPIAAYVRYPGVLDLWRFDLVGRIDGGYSAINQPVWYYLAMLPGELAPWTPAAAVGLIVTARAAFTRRGSPERFLWCWAAVPVLCLSLPAGKHHHYLLSVMPPWALLTALGMLKCRDYLFSRPAWIRHPAWILGVVALPAAIGLWRYGDRLPGPPWIPPAMTLVWLTSLAIAAWMLWKRRGVGLMATLLVAVTITYAWEYSCIETLTDQTQQDTDFIREAARLRPASMPLMLNADIGSMDFFRIAFYLAQPHVTLQSLDYLRDARTHRELLWLITRAGDEARLTGMGAVRLIAQSAHSRGETSPADRLTLYEVRMRPDLPLLDLPAAITPMQAMSRQ